MRYFSLILYGGLPLLVLLACGVVGAAEPALIPPPASPAGVPAASARPIALRLDEVRNDSGLARSTVTIPAMPARIDTPTLRLSPLAGATAVLPSEVAGEANRLRGEQWAQQAREAVQRDDTASAVQAWTEAVRNDPAHPWYRLGLAQGQMQLGQHEQALANVQALLKIAPDNEHGLYLQAQLAAREARWSDALVSLERIPPAKRAPYMLDLRRLAKVTFETGEARQAAAQGQQTAAWLALRRAEAYASGNAELIGALARGYVEIGLPDDGFSLLREHMRRETVASTGLQLEQAGLLMKTGDQAGFDAAMKSLSAVPMNGVEQARYAELQRMRNIRAGERLRERGELPAADRELSAVVLRHPEDAWAQAALARLRAAQQRPGEALELYRSLLERDPQNADLLRGAAWTSVQAGDKPGARELMNRAVAAAPDDAAVQLDATRLAGATGGRGGAVPMDAQVQLDSPHPTGSEFTAGLSTRQRTGDSGTRQLSAVELPMRAQTALAGGQLSLAVTPVYLDAGEFSSGPFIARTFGGGPLLALDASNTLLVSPRGGSRYSRYARGVGASLGYQIDGFQADVGFSPDGFLFDQVVGGLGYAGTAGPRDALWYSITLERRAVTDSVLSWSGSFDPRGGDIWGSVVRSGGLLNLNYDFGPFSINGYGGHDRFEGENVRDNHRSRAGISAQWPLIRREDHILRVGLGASLLAYDNNQGHFTWGHGGYFSPQQYWWAGVPVEWAWRGPRLGVRLNGSLGFQSIAEDAADYFPTNPAWQAQAAIVMATQVAGVAGLGGTPVYRSSDDSGMAYNLSAAAEYTLADRYALGFTAGINNASDYSQWSGGLYLRYVLAPASARAAFPLVPFDSPYAH